MKLSLLDTSHAFELNKGDLISLDETKVIFQMPTPNVKNNTFTLDGVEHTVANTTPVFPQLTLDATHPSFEGVEYFKNWYVNNTTLILALSGSVAISASRITCEDAKVTHIDSFPVVTSDEPEDDDGDSPELIEFNEGGSWDGQEYDSDNPFNPYYGGAELYEMLTPAVQDEVKAAPNASEWMNQNTIHDLTQTPGFELGALQTLNDFQRTAINRFYNKVLTVRDDTTAFEYAGRLFTVFDTLSPNN